MNFLQISGWYIYLLRQRDGFLRSGISKNILKQLVGVEPLRWYKCVGSKEEAITEEARIALLSNEEKESLLPWYSPTPEFRRANILLDNYFRVTPPIINGMNMKEYREWLMTFHVSVRDSLVRKYAWAIPTEEAIRTIIKYGPTVEMGAGTGYWAYLIRLLGGDVIAYDVNPPWGNDNDPPSDDISFSNWNIWHSGASYTEVLRGDPSILSQHFDRTLFLCWPPINSIMAIECLLNWTGRILILIGEREITASETFFDQLNERFSLQEIVPIPQWANASDKMTIWKRLG